MYSIYTYTRTYIYEKFCLCYRQNSSFNSPPYIPLCTPLACSLFLKGPRNKGNGRDEPLLKTGRQRPCSSETSYLDPNPYGSPEPQPSLFRSTLFDYTL